MAATAPFSLQTITIRVDCDVVDKQTGERPYEGFWINVRRNLTNGEREALLEAVRAIDDDSVALNEQRNAAAEAYRIAIAQARGDDDTPADQPMIESLITAEAASIDEYIKASAAIVDRRYHLIAPHIHGWNLYDFTDPADPVPVPSPRDDAATARSFLNTDLIVWMLTATLQAYRLGFAIGSLKFGAQPEPTHEPSAEKTKD